MNDGPRENLDSIGFGWDGSNQPKGTMNERWTSCRQIWSGDIVGSKTSCPNTIKVNLQNLFFNKIIRPVKLKTFPSFDKQKFRKLY